MGSCCSIDLGADAVPSVSRTASYSQNPAVSRSNSYSYCTTDGCNQFDEYCVLPEVQDPSTVEPEAHRPLKASDAHPLPTSKFGGSLDVCSDAVVSFDMSLNTPLTPQKQRLLSPVVTFRDTVSVFVEMPTIDMPQSVSLMHDEVIEGEQGAISARTCGGVSDTELSALTDSASNRDDVVLSPQSDCQGYAVACTERPLIRSCVPHRLQQARQLSLLYMKRSI